MNDFKTITYKEISQLIGVSVRTIHQHRVKWWLDDCRTAHKMPIQFWRKKMIAKLKQLGLIE